MSGSSSPPAAPPVSVVKGPPCAVHPADLFGRTITVGAGRLARSPSPCPTPTSAADSAQSVSPPHSASPPAPRLASSHAEERAVCRAAPDDSEGGGRPGHPPKQWPRRRTSPAGSAPPPHADVRAAAPGRDAGGAAADGPQTLDLTDAGDQGPPPAHPNPHHAVTPAPYARAGAGFDGFEAGGGRHPDPAAAAPPCG